MKSVTYEEFLKFEPCWLEDKEQAAKLERIGRRRKQWTALDVLDLPKEEVSVEDKLWAVLRPEFIEENILHEFACWCAEEALKLDENPDPRCIAAIEAKRKWIRGEIGDEELEAAREAALAAAWDAAWDAASDAALDAAWYAASDAAWDAAWCAAWCAASAAAKAAAKAAARAAALDAARKRQVEILKELLKDG